MLPLLPLLLRNCNRVATLQKFDRHYLTLRCYYFNIRTINHRTNNSQRVVCRQFLRSNIEHTEKHCVVHILSLSLQQYTIFIITIIISHNTVPLSLPSLSLNRCHLTLEWRAMKHDVSTNLDSHTDFTNTHCNLFLFTRQIRFILHL